MKYYSVDEVAAILGVAPETIRRYLREGKLKGFKVGKEWRTSEHRIREFVERGANFD